MITPAMAPTVLTAYTRPSERSPDFDRSSRKVMSGSVMPAQNVAGSMTISAIAVDVRLKITNPPSVRATDESIHPARRSIYERGFRAQFQADRAAEALWLMLVTWNACIDNVPSGGTHRQRWEAFLDRLGLLDPAARAARIRQAIDYVSLVDRVVEGWAAENGV